VIGLAAILVLVCQLTDHTPRTIARQIEVIVSKRAERRMLGKFGLLDLETGGTASGGHRELTPRD